MAEKKKEQAKWPPSRFTCMECGYSTPFYSKAQLHIDTEHSGGRIDCDVTRTDEPKPA